MSFEEIRNLIKLEKQTEQELAKAREEAAKMIEKAEEDAHKIIKEAEEQDYNLFFKDRVLEIEERKKSIERETDQKANVLIETANKNLDKTVSFIVSSISGESKI